MIENNLEKHSTGCFDPSHNHKEEGGHDDSDFEAALDL